MRLVTLLAVLPIAAACTLSETPSRGAPPPPAHGPPPQPGAGPGPAPGTPPASVPVTGPLPAGYYDVRERVLFDSCRLPRTLPPRVTLLRQRDGNRLLANVPVQRFGDFAKESRMQFDIRGFDGNGMTHPKVCPGLQNTYRERLVNTSQTSFEIHVEFEVADGWDCPNPRPQPVCKTAAVYEYRLASAVCDARCDGFVPNVRDEDVPDGPVAITCICR